MDRIFHRLFTSAVGLLLTLVAASAQYPFESFSKIGGEEEIRGVLAEGSDGFIWIGSPNGLQRYDGRNFKLYKHDPADSTSIKSDHIYAILALPGKLWLGTEFGISVFDLHAQTFRNYSFFSEHWSDWRNTFPYNRVAELYQDRQGEIWIGTHQQGLWRYDQERDTFVAYSEREYPLLRDNQGRPYQIASIRQSPVNDSIIWAGTTGGLLELNKYSKEQKLHIFPYEDVVRETALNIFLEIFPHTDGRVYAGNWTEGVYVYDPQTGAYDPIPVRNDEQGLLDKVYTREFYPHADTQFWITTGKGVALYDTETQQIVYSKTNVFADREFYGINLIDKRKRCWFDSGDGIRLFDPQMQQFEEYSIAPLFSGGEVANIFYMVYDSTTRQVVMCPRRADGLYLLQGPEREWTKLRMELPTKDINRVYGFARISSGRYLVSSRIGLFVYDLKRRQLYRITLPDHIQTTFLREVMVSSTGEVWIAINNVGLLRTDTNFREFREYQTELEPGNINLSTTGVLFEDSQRNVYLKRNYGFSVYDFARDTFHNFIYQIDSTHSFRVVDDFTEDQQGRVWTCSVEGWIGYTEVDHPEAGLVKKMNISDFGIGGYVFNMATDSKGRIWGITEYDVIEIDPEDLTIRNYSMRYGARDFDFFTFEMLPNDDMLFGSWISVLGTNARQLRQNDELPIPYISSLSIRNEGEREPYPLFGHQSIHLKHNQNFFTIFYSAQAYTLGDKVSFRYRLRGFDEWNDVGNSQIATYTNVPSGDYTFELQAANNEGIWNEEALSIPISVDQPWFTSGWFLLTLLVFLALFVFSVYQYRVNQIRNEADLRTAYEKKLASVEMNALLAQMNPHFIFNSLNSIDSFILKNESRQASEYLNDFARLIRLILQNSRSESIRLRDELETLELYLKMEQLRFKGRFEYDIIIGPAVDVDQLEIPPMLVQPYVENAVWHGIMHLPEDQPGHLEVKIFKEGGKLQIQVTDNGVGRVRSREIKEKKIRHKQSMGMKITHDRIDLINTLYNANARIDISDLYTEEHQPKGTEVFITLSI